MAGGGLGHIYAIRDRRMRRYARIPYESHNAHPFRGGLLMNHSPTHRMMFTDMRGRIQKTWAVPVYDESELEFSNVPRDHAYQGFCRGIAETGENIIVQGSSPATINLFRWGPARADQVHQRDDGRAELGARTRDLAVPEVPTTPPPPPAG